MDNLNFDDLTPEQKKELQEVVTKARNRLLWASIKAWLGLFAANFVCLLVGAALFVDSDPGIVVGYQGVCIVVNAIFMSTYFSSAMKINSDTVQKKIKEISNR